MHKSSDTSHALLAATEAGSWMGGEPGTDADELVGTTLNETYVVERVLGEGGMGRVYLARHTRIDQKRVAVKVLHREYARNTEVLARFQREAEAAASVSHPNVVAVYDVDRTPAGMPYLVCEYLEGVDLSEHLEQVDRLNPDQAVSVGLQICDGLMAAHAASLIHRDLKPQNIFLVGEPSSGRMLVKILDFGLSKFLETNSGTLTKTGIIMGTPSFMAPEQAKGQRADHRADVYGVGAILYTAVTGRLPFDESSPQATVLAVMSQDPVRPRSIVPSIPEYLELVIERAMAKDPAERYPSIHELRLALERMAAVEAASFGDTTAVSRARAGSRVDLTSDTDEGWSSRSRLGFFLLAGAALGAALLISAGSALVRLTHFAPSPTERWLLLAFGAGALLPPLWVMLRRLRRNVWGNTTRVMALLAAVRSAVLAATVSYAVAALLLRVIVALPASLQRMAVPVVDLADPRWDVLLPLAALVAAALASVRQRALSVPLTRTRRLAAAVLLLIQLLAVPSVLAAGLGWLSTEALAAADASPPEPSAPAPTPAPVAPATTAAAQKPLAAPRGEPAAVDRRSKRASPEELTDASAAGLPALRELGERYPGDPDVVRALLLSYASRSDGLPDAMATAKRLLALAPERALDKDLQYLVIKAAESGGVEAERAFDLLGAQMGSTGPDLLYDALFTKPKIAARSQAVLSMQSVRERASPALAIAFDLKTAKSCRARVPLLERAAQVGDERSAAILNQLSTGTKKGCGKWKRRPCKPACAEEAKLFREAVAAINARTQAKKQ